MGRMPDIKYLICQYEHGLLNTPHVQGFVWFVRPRRLSEVRRLLLCEDGRGARWVAANGTVTQNYDYCTKEEGRILGPWEVGQRPGNNNGHVIHRKYELLQEDLDDGMTLKESLSNHFELGLKHGPSIQRYRLLKIPERKHKTMVIFMFGPRNSGKTYYVKQQDPNYFRKPLKTWFDGYDGQETVLYDDFLSLSYGPIQGHLAAFDKYKLKVKVHFGYAQWRPSVIFVTSNMRPDELFPQLQIHKPHLVQAFWNRIEYIMEFEERDGLHSPSNYRFLEECRISNFVWTPGFKRGH